MFLPHINSRSEHYRVLIMNQLRAWLYGHDSAKNAHNQPKQSPRTRRSLSKENQDEIAASETQQWQENQRMASTESSPTRLRNAFLTVVPLAPGDCLECKLVGTGVMMISGIIILVSAVTARKRNPALRGLKGAIYSAICGVLFVGFESTAFCRMMDLGPFDKSKTKHSQ